MLLIKDDVAAAQLYHSLCSPRWYRWPLICLSEIGLFSLPFPVLLLALMGPLVLVEEAQGAQGFGVVLVVKMVCVVSVFNGNSGFCAVDRRDAKIGQCWGFVRIERPGVDQEQQLHWKVSLPMAVGLEQDDF